MPLIYPVGFFGGARRAVAPIMQATPWALPSAAVQNTAADWTNYQNAFVENDAAATHYLNSITGRYFDVAGFDFSLTQGALVYGFECQIRWKVSATGPYLARISLLDIAANAIVTADAVGPNITGSTDFRTETYQLTVTGFLFDSPVPYINSDAWGLTAQFLPNLVQPSATVSIAWMKLRFLYYAPAPGNVLAITPERYPQTVAQLGDKGRPWSNLDAVKLRDGTLASAAGVAGGATSDTIVASNFGHAIPERALPFGIMLTARGYCVNTAGLLYAPVSFHKHSGAAGGQYSGDTAFVSNDSALNERSLFRTDNWGLGNLTPADVNGAGFGVAFSLAPSSSLQTTDRYIDSVATRILYTALT